MAIYVMSDIHGDYKSYIRMLELINFSDKDELFVIGDVIDRHPGGVEILLDIMDRPNVHMLWGNHEMMMYQGVVCHDRENWSMWIMNGGGVTRKSLFYREETAKRRERILTFLRKLPLFKEIEIEGRRFYLVHAMPGTTVQECLWARADEIEPTLVEGATVIAGHTPTPYLSGDPFGPGEILHEEGIIYIDCGCGSSYDNRQLGCLRLDDMREFYIKCVPDN